MTTIGKYEDIRLEAPSSVAVQLDIIHLAADNLPRALYAALGVCWRGRGRPRVDYARCGYRPALYGGQVLQELVTRGDGTTIDQVVAAGGVALGKLTEAVGGLDGGDVKETADFTEAPAPSTSK